MSDSVTDFMMCRSWLRIFTLHRHEGCHMRIYMDVCCLCRPFDNLAQDRVGLEAIAVTDILARCRSGLWTLAASAFIDLELSAMRDGDKLLRVRQLYAVARHYLPLTRQMDIRARVLQSQGLQSLDSFHLALAETGGQNVFLTTDDKLLKKVAGLRLDIRAANPIHWFMEAF